MMWSSGKRRSALVAFLASALVGTLSLSPGVAGAAPTAGAQASSSPAVAPAKLGYLGTVNFSSLSGTAGQRQSAASGGGSWRAVDDAAAHFQGKSTPSVAAPGNTVAPGNVSGERGFIGLNGYQQALVNGGVDLEPPDQGLCAGRGYVGEFVNDAFTVYQPDGSQVLPVLPAYKLVKQPSTSFMSDPRCYYDGPTQRWFLYIFDVGTADGKTPSLQFVDVSRTADPTGTYDVWSIDTTDKGYNHCPCFGDYDVPGADDNGIYIATDEFGLTAGFNGSVVYAVSKLELETYSQTLIPPGAFAYHVGAQPFGISYIVSPTSTPEGGQFAPNTEYFVESNINTSTGHALAVFAMHNTSTLAAFPAKPPKLYVATVNTEHYGPPPAAAQQAGPAPLARSVQDPIGHLQADFDAVMQTTYASGNLYAELDTGTTTGDAAAWFILKPTLSGGTLSASVVHQGYVAVPGASLLYPAIGVTAGGEGYMTFSLSGPQNHPSAAYVDFSPQGAFGQVHVAFAGAGVEDSFTCYAAFVGPGYGGCRWGDYSAAVASGNRVYMATETVPGTSRDTLTNWGTYVFSAPPPPPPPSN